MQNSLLLSQECFSREAREDYTHAEHLFVDLLEAPHLDRERHQHQAQIEKFEQVLQLAIQSAYHGDHSMDAEAHRFLQRILYRINRLNLFWYDDFRHYTNERSPYIRNIRDLIESAWQAWELQQLGTLASIQQLDIDGAKQALTERAARDLEPELSEDSRYLRESMTYVGYCHLLAIASFDGLVEASRLSRILGGAANEIQCTLIRVLLEEYGGGRLQRKHSTFFARMMEELGLNSEPEAYFDLVLWQVLAGINHNFLLTECKQFFLQYNGGLAYFEVAGPAAYRNYLMAAKRLKLSEAAMGYWDLHIKEDERHGRWMMDDVVMPLADRYPDRAWQLVLGYDQEKYMGDRASAAVVRSVKQAEMAYKQR